MSENCKKRVKIKRELRRSEMLQDGNVVINLNRPRCWNLWKILCQYFGALGKKVVSQTITSRGGEKTEIKTR